MKSCNYCIHYAQISETVEKKLQKRLYGPPKTVKKDVMRDYCELYKERINNSDRAERCPHYIDKRTQSSLDSIIKYETPDVRFFG
jgi:hypothetical protein